MFDSKSLAQAYYGACLAEIEALKPGNVHIFADGHGMIVQDFIRSAEISTPIITNAEFSLGQRIFLSVEATWQAVKCNTNLGIVLLCAPLVQAALNQKKQIISDKSLSHEILKAIQSSTVDDAQYMFDAIKLANPAGLGKAASHDVNERAQTNLFESMQASADKDLIARQYCNGFSDIFNLALPYYREALSHWEKPAWATTALYLYWLANYPDSHVLRKYGLTTASKLRLEAEAHLANLHKHSNPKSYQTELMRFDKTLKSDHVNPGTSADLTVATLLAHAIVNI